MDLKFKLCVLVLILGITVDAYRFSPRSKGKLTRKTVGQHYDKKIESRSLLKIFKPYFYAFKARKA